jgi:hypothetical protein
MKAPSWPAAILAGLIAAGAVGTASAATTYTWRFVVTEEATKSPVEGMAVDFTLTDGSNSRQTALKCVTDAAGVCTLSGAVSGGGFFSYSRADGNFKVTKEGYLTTYKAQGRQLGDTTREVTVQVTPRHDSEFTLVAENGMPIDGATISIVEGSKVLNTCTTDAAGSCSIALERELTTSAVASKPGFYKQLLPVKGAKRTLSADLRPQVVAAEFQARVACTRKDECDRTYSAAQIYMARIVDMKGQFSNETITETFNPTKEDEMGGRVTRAPARGSSGWEVTLEVYCGKSKAATTLIEEAFADSDDQKCRQRQLSAYEPYRDFVMARSR